jgi:hypothetical protein
LQRLAQGEEDVLLVVDEEDAVGHHHTPGRGSGAARARLRSHDVSEFLLTGITA